MLDQCTEAVQCNRGLLVILTENKKFNLRFDSRQSRIGHPQSKILATPMLKTSVHCLSHCFTIVRDSRHQAYLLTPSYVSRDRLYILPLSDYFATFGMQMQNDTPMTKNWPKSKPEVEFQYGGRPFSETANMRRKRCDVIRSPFMMVQ